MIGRTNRKSDPLPNIQLFAKNMNPSEKRNAILISIFIGIIYSVTTDKWIFDHLRAKPDISFLAFAVQNLLLPSLIFLFVSGVIGYIFLWSLNKISKGRLIILKLTIIGLSFCFFYLSVIVGAEIYYWVIAWGCGSC